MHQFAFLRALAQGSAWELALLTDDKAAIACHPPILARQERLLCSSDKPARHKKHFASDRRALRHRLLKTLLSWPNHAFTVAELAMAGGLAPASIPGQINKMRSCLNFASG